jgi:hypothetical protein
MFILPKVFVSAYKSDLFVKIDLSSRVVIPGSHSAKNEPRGVGRLEAKVGVLSHMAKQATVLCARDF